MLRKGCAILLYVPKQTDSPPKYVGITKGDLRFIKENLRFTKERFGFPEENYDFQEDLRMNT